MPRKYNSHPIGIPWGNQYITLLRWLERHTGPKVRTLTQLRHALKQPEVFYILPREYRKEEPPPQPGDDVQTEVLG